MAKRRANKRAGGAQKRAQGIVKKIRPVLLQLVSEEHAVNEHDTLKALKKNMLPVIRELQTSSRTLLHDLESQVRRAEQEHALQRSGVLANLVRSALRYSKRRESACLSDLGREFMATPPSPLSSPSASTPSSPSASTPSSPSASTSSDSLGWLTEKTSDEEN